MVHTNHILVDVSDMVPTRGRDKVCSSYYFLVDVNNNGPHQDRYEVYGSCKSFISECC